MARDLREETGAVTEHLRELRASSLQTAVALGASNAMQCKCELSYGLTKYSICVARMTLYALQYRGKRNVGGLCMFASVYGCMCVFGLQRIRECMCAMYVRMRCAMHIYIYIYTYMGVMEFNACRYVTALFRFVLHRFE